MSHYRSNLRDVEFNLFEVLGLPDRLASGAYPDFDVDIARTILREIQQLAEGPIAQSYVDADRHPPIFDPETNSVKMPDSFKKSFEAWTDSEWWRLQLGPQYGGTAAPPSLIWAGAEFVLGANPAVWMYDCGPAFAEILHRVGTAEQSRIGSLIVEQRWGTTMALTEPEAGSDVGAGRTRATRQPDGTWHLSGVKRFITSAEHDLSDNIVHFVLARPEGAGPGSKGLSMFLVPKFLFEIETGALGARNGVFVTGVEHKLGLRASTTCEVRFGETIPAVGYLVGEVHNGIAQMFQVIANARMMVGTKAAAQLSTGYLNALDYARTRIQSADLTRSGDSAAPRVPIIAHPEVRRSLMLQKAYAEGLRALVLFTASVQDEVQIAEYQRRDSGLRRSVADLLLPIVKGASSERAYEQLAQSLQVLGGSGYVQDYPIEQYLRDTKIDSLYEGTTAIQAQDFFFRKIVRDHGAALQTVSQQIAVTVDSLIEVGRLKVERDALSQALTDFGAMVQSMLAQLASVTEDERNIYKVGQNATRLLMSAGDLLVGWLLVRQSEVALRRLDGNDLAPADRAFYEGKLAVARFFAVTVLPELTSRAAVVSATDNALMDVPVESF